MIYQIALTLMILGIAIAMLGINGFGRRLDLWPVGWGVFGFGLLVAALNLVWTPS